MLLIILSRRARRDAKLTEEIVETVDETDEEGEIVKAELVELKG